jgi:hypothetical protein
MRPFQDGGSNGFAITCDSFFLDTYYGVIPAILLHSTIYRIICLVGIYFLCQAPQHLAILGLLVYK